MDIARVEKPWSPPCWGTHQRALKVEGVRENHIGLPVLDLEETRALGGAAILYGRLFSRGRGLEERKKMKYYAFEGTGRLFPLGWGEVMLFLESVASHQLSVTLWDGHIQGSWELGPSTCAEGGTVEECFRFSSGERGQELKGGLSGV